MFVLRKVSYTAEDGNHLERGSVNVGWPAYDTYLYRYFLLPKKNDGPKIKAKIPKNMITAIV